MNTYEARLERMLAAVHLSCADRIPFMSSGTASNARYCGVKLADYVSDMPLNLETNLKGTEMFCDPDGTQAVLYCPDGMSSVWLGKVKVPGRELSDNELWQMEEKENIHEEDYDDILENGYGPWLDKVLMERLDNPMKYTEAYAAYLPEAMRILREKGYPNFMGNSFFSPIEQFCGGRTLMNFFGSDLIEFPDKVDAVFRLVQDYNIANWDAQLKATQPVAAWVGGWRGTPDLLNSEMFERFAWKYIRELAEMCLANNVIPLFHLDSDWTRGLQYFRDLPKGSCILGLDGMTDIFNAKEVIGEHCCLMGGVPPTMLAFGSTEDVEAYCRRLIKEVGPDGFIMSAGCDAPFNSRLENMRTMAESVGAGPV